MSVRPPKLAIAGTGRTGSRWLATVLARAGINAGHEAYFSGHQEPEQVTVDVSWLASAR